MPDPEVVLDGVRECDPGGGKRTSEVVASDVGRVRLTSRLSQVHFVAALEVSKRTLEQWEPGRRTPSGAAPTLLKIVGRHPEVLLEVVD